MRAPARSEKVTVRFDPAERDVIENAATQSRVSLAAFIRMVALAAVESTGVLDGRDAAEE